MLFVASDGQLENWALWIMVACVSAPVQTEKYKPGFTYMATQPNRAATSQTVLSRVLSIRAALLGASGKGKHYAPDFFKVLRKKCTLAKIGGIV